MELYSSPLKGIRHEAFCQRVSKGARPYEAYMEVNPKCTKPKSAAVGARLWIKREDVRGRLEYLERMNLGVGKDGVVPDLSTPDGRQEVLSEMVARYLSLIHI